MEILTPTEARFAIRSQKGWKASVAEGEEFPLYDNESTRVRLFKTVKDAVVYFRTRTEALDALGYKKLSGTFGRGVLQYQKEEGRVVIALDKIATKKKDSPERPERTEHALQLTLIQGGNENDNDFDHAA